MRVLKFGGTSVANSTNISKVVSILQSKSKDDRLVVVVSALGGITDLLQQTGELANLRDSKYLEVYQHIKDRHLKTASELELDAEVIHAIEERLKELKKILQGIYLINEFSAKTKDKVLSYGELLSSFVILESLKLKVAESVLKDSREIIVTDSSFTQAQLNSERTAINIQQYFETNHAKVTLMPGFVSRSSEGDITTLGRGGSDFTASILAGALNATVLEIWTDVSGMYTANPKLVRQAFPIDRISYHEAMELSHFGAKVLYPPSIRPVLENNIPLLIKNTFEPEAEGTFIHDEVYLDQGPVKGISHLSDIALLTLEGSGMVGIPGFSKRLFASLYAEKINVVLITQASSEHSICVGVQASDSKNAENVINGAFAYEISLGKIDPLLVEPDLAIIAVIGDSMKNHQGVSGKMFSALGENNVNIRAIAQGASERNISAVIDVKDVKKALNTLHYRFFERQMKTLNLFITGVGNVGQILLDQIRQQQEHLSQNLLINLRIVGLSNSRKMIFDETGINISDWQSDLENGVDRNLAEWFQMIKELNLRNSIFIDVTANEEVAASYGDYLRESISVIACNKIACSSSYAYYRKLKELSKRYGASFLFETNVGAGLPIINTLSNLINSGDKISSIRAVLSGSLNFIFNNFNTERSFYDVVLQAQSEGYTEPDPRIDLSGIDVARKILILARESGQQLDIEEIENISFLPEASLEAKSVTDFFDSLKSEAAHFNDLFDQAQKRKNRLKYVAEYNNGNAKVSLEEVGSDHPFYNLDGKDNIVLFYTSRYSDQPLIIKGAGAGAEVTASGLFGDIISLGKE